MALSRDQMARMAALLEPALELDREGRERWLQALRPEDQDLKPVLRRSLLAVEAPPFTLPRLADATQLKPGDPVGPYRLMRPLGSGGMAEVWLAQRADGAFKREVALKLPTLRRDRADLAERFARETEILAQLEHPRIARLYDAGVTQPGLPYLAMEYVQGQPILPGCQEMDLGAKLSLFLQVLEAVQYAHGKGVVHRDLKPSNILVGADGQVHLLDFGVAKLLERPETRELTEVYGRALTPQYASPELLKGDTVDAAADVYALGVLLYELLAGVRPYELKSSSADELHQALAATQIAPPSTKRAELKGDLDAIVLKALSRNPGQRYASARAFADDLQRYLDRKPIGARPPTPGHRMSLFVSRHTPMLWATAGFILIAAVAVAGWLHKALPPPSAPVTVAPEKSIAVLPFLDMSEKHDQEYFSDGLADDLLDLLSRIPSLKVAARTSAFSFKGKSDDIPTIARKLLVANVLEGSVRKAGDRLRITVQLVRADNGYQLWSQVYDRRFDDIFKMQDEIAAAVVQALKVSLLEGPMPVASSTKSSEGYTLYLQARSLYFHASTKEDWDRLFDYLQRAVRLDPAYAPAWAMFSRVRSYQAANDYVPHNQGWEEARRAADTALSLDSKLPDAHTAMAAVLFDHWDWNAGQAQVDQALALDPDNSWALAWKANRLLVIGELEEGLSVIRRSIANDPINPDRYLQLASATIATKSNRGNLAEGLAAARKALDLNPSIADAHGIAGQDLLMMGSPASSLIEASQEKNEESRLLVQALSFHALGKKAESDLALAQLEKSFAKENAYDIAQVHAFRGEVDQAFGWLDRAFRQRDWGCTSLKIDPFARSLAADSRFNALLRKMHIPD